MIIRIFSLTLVFLSFLTSFSIFSQNRSVVCEKYITTYKYIAISNMKTYKIPASITMAQGLLESAAGQSPLAINANNHFGMKVKSNWTGERIEYKNDIYKKYPSIKDSYIDHSVHISSSARYESLFKLSITDYKSWANGLLKCGYAVDSLYPVKLIRIIELYELYLLDK